MFYFHFCTCKISIQTILMGHFPTFWNIPFSIYFFFFNFSVLLSVAFHTLIVTLYTNLCKDFVLRLHIFVFLQIMLELPLRFIAYCWVEEIVNLNFVLFLVLCNYLMLGVHIVNISETIFLKLIFYLRLSYQLIDFFSWNFVCIKVCNKSLYLKQHQCVIIKKKW